MSINFFISWAAPINTGSSAITSYDIGYTLSGDSETIVATGSAATNYTLTGLNSLGAYTVRVRAVNAAGPGPWSDSVTQLAAEPPEQITDLAASAISAADVLLTWSAPASSPAISEYEVEYFALFGEYSGGDDQYMPLLPNPPGEATSAEYTIPEAEQMPSSFSVSLRIRAVNAAGAAPWSNIATVSLVGF